MLLGVEAADEGNGGLVDEGADEAVRGGGIGAVERHQVRCCCCCCLWWLWRRESLPAGRRCSRVGTEA